MTLSMLLFPLMKSMVGEAINDAAATVGIVLAQHASATAIAVADVLYCQVSPNKFPGQTECGAGFDFHNSGFHSIFLFNRSGNQHIRCRWLPIVTELSGLRWFFNTEVGALLKCQNSVRALNDPKWSWKEDMQLAQLPLDDECCQVRRHRQ
ncbi:unnamed protein product [Linum trigynum]|uniref:Uncharacterized protein n=1 Tax=Linum trigynum TaxID=586398 RepID=A0AAV2E477_9ROSI